MAEPLGVLGAVSASVDLADRILKYFRGFRDAPRHAADLVGEVVAVGHVMGTLRARLQTANAASNTYDRTSVLFFAVNGCQTRLQEVSDILQPVLSDQSGLRKFWNRLKWPLEKDQAVEIILALHRYAQILHFAAELDGLHAVSKFQHEAMDEIRKRLESMERSQSEAVTTGTQEALTAIRALPDMSADVAKLNQTLNELVLDRETLQLLEAIPGLPYQARHRDLQLRRMQGAGQWILDEPKFLDWRDGRSASNILWLNGGPGVGKTFISSVIIDYLKQCRAMGFHATLFFYFEYSRQGEEGPITFLQTLLHQLVSRSPFIPPDISKLLTEAYKRRELLSWDELKAAFIGLCEASGKVFLVLDALDECDETSNRQPVIQLLEDLKRCKVRILITSRRFAPDIDQLLGHCCNIMVQTADSDIRAYIVNQIARSPRASRLMSEALRDSVISSTLAKSQGMFLLAALQIANILGQTNEREIIRALDNQPSGLTANFDLTIDRIKKQDTQSNTRANLGLSVLLWLSSAKRALTARELQIAVAISPQEGRMDELTDPDFFVDCCFGLVIRDENTDIIRLVHQSVYEYLQSREEPLFPNGPSVIARSCIWYSLQTLPRVVGVLNSDQVPALSSVQRPWIPVFFGYSTAFCMVHADESQDSVLVPYIRQSFTPSVLSDWARSVGLVRTLGSWGIQESTAKILNEGCTLLHIAVVFEVRMLVEDILRKLDINANARDRKGITPLIAAAACGRDWAVQQLLSRPDIEINLKDYSNSSPLDWAVNYDHVSAVEKLLNSPHRVDIPMDETLTTGSSILKLVDDYFRRDILKAYLGSPYLDLRSPSLAATANKQPLWANLADRWDPPTFRALINRPDFDPRIYGSPSECVGNLSRSAKKLNYAVATEYQMGALDMDLVGRRNNRLAAVPAVIHALFADQRFEAPPLSILAPLWPFVSYVYCDGLAPTINQAGNLEYVIDWMRLTDTPSGTLRQLFRTALESEGITFHFQESGGRSFVHYLAHSGNVMHLDFLLGLGSPFVEDALRSDTSDRAPLHYAAMGGNEYVVRALLFLGGNVLATDCDGWTPLHHAVYHGHESVTNLLLSRGIAADQPVYTMVDNLGRSLLHLAATSHNATPVLSLLLDRGFDLRVVDKAGRTPLFKAVQHQNYDACRLLLENGADPDHIDLFGTSLICATLHFPDRAILSLLLRQSSLSLDNLNSAGLDVFQALSRTPNHRGTSSLHVYIPSASAVAPANPAHNEKRHRHIVQGIRSRLRLFVPADDPERREYAWGLAQLLIRLGDTSSAQIMLETFADEYSKATIPSFGISRRYGLRCVGCHTTSGYLFRCITCDLVLVCEKCRLRLRGQTLAGNDEMARLARRRMADCPPGGHEYLRIPREEWSRLPRGAVTGDGKTFGDWLRELEERYGAMGRGLGVEGV